MPPSCFAITNATIIDYLDLDGANYFWTPICCHILIDGEIESRFAKCYLGDL